MRHLSWTSLCILSSVLCATCVVECSGDLQSANGLNVLERRQKDAKSAPTAVLEDSSAAATTDDPPKPTKVQNDEPKNSRKTSAAPETSPAAQPTSTAKTKGTSAKPTSPSPSSSDSTEKSDSSTSPTSISSSSASTSPSSSTSTDASQSTSSAEPEPQSGSQVSVGGIIAGIILGAGSLVGASWIAIAKWRENRRRRAHSGDDEAKPGFAGATADGRDSPCQDSLLGERKPLGGSNGLVLQSLSPPSRASGFGRSFHERRGSRIPQDVLPPFVPEQDEDVTQLPPGQSPFSSPPGWYSDTSEWQSPYDEMIPTGLQASQSVSREALPQVSYSSPLGAQWRQSAHQLSQAAELPAWNPTRQRRLSLSRM
jgi:hypothetical protein